MSIFDGGRIVSLSFPILAAAKEVSIEYLRHRVKC